MKLKIRAVILENPVLLPIQWQTNHHEREKMTQKGDFWQNGCHKCLCSCMMSTGACCVKTGCVHQNNYKKIQLAPWMWCGMSKWKHTDEKGTESYRSVCCPCSCTGGKLELLMKPDPMNLQNDNEINVSARGLFAGITVWEMLKSEKFITEIYSKRKVEGAMKTELSHFGEQNINVVKREPNFKSTDIIDWILKFTDIKIIVLIGDGDPFIPKKGILEAFKDVKTFEKNTKAYQKLEKFFVEDIKKSIAKLDFSEEFERVEEDEPIESEKQQQIFNLEFVRLKKMGHLLFVEDHKKHMSLLMSQMGLPTFSNDAADEVSTDEENENKKDILYMVT